MPKSFPHHFFLCMLRRPRAGVKSRRRRGDDAYSIALNRAVVLPCVTLLQVMTRRNRSMDANLPDLGDLEREVMQLVWANAPVTAEAVRERLARRLKESTVRTV